MIKCLYLKHVAKILIFFDTPNDFPDNLTLFCVFFSNTVVFSFCLHFLSLFSNKKADRIPAPCF